MISVFRPVDAAPEAVGMPYIVCAGNVGGDQALAQPGAILSAHRKPVTMRSCPSLWGSITRSQPARLPPLQDGELVAQIKISAVFHVSSRRDSRSRVASRMIRRSTNRRHMIDDHHGPSAGRTNLLLRAVDGILGTHRSGMATRTGIAAGQTAA